MLAGKTIIITGAAQGMGRATAERCVAEGATVLLTDRDARVEDVARELGAQSLVGDVTDAGLAARAVERAGAVHGLVNVAGVHHQATAADIGDGDWERVLAVNLTAPLLWARAATTPAGSAARTRSPPPAPTCCPTRRRSSTASTCSSTAAAPPEPRGER